jgi:hypothetical protein
VIVAVVVFGFARRGFARVIFFFSSGVLGLLADLDLGVMVCADLGVVVEPWV